MNEVNKALEALLQALKDYNRALIEASAEGNQLANLLLKELVYEQQEPEAPFPVGFDPDDDEAEMVGETESGAYRLSH